MILINVFISLKKVNLLHWKKITKTVLSTKKIVNIAIIVKYVNLKVYLLHHKLVMINLVMRLFTRFIIPKRYN